MGVELCAVQARHFQLKCHQAEAFDVAMSDVGETTRGVKRKLEEALDTGSQQQQQQQHCRMRSRQSVFHLSVCKLNRFRQSSAEACLLRSVLVWNTLRRIQCEMERDGIRLNLNPSLLAPPEDLTLDPLPNSETTEPHFSDDPHPNHIMPNCPSVCYEHEPSRWRLTPVPKCSSGAPLWSEHEMSSDRLSSLNWSSLLSLSTSGSSSSSPSSVQAESASEETSLHTLMPPPHHQLHNTTVNNSYTSVNSSSGSEEIFGDIDLSLYDFDLLSPLSPPHVKLAPVSAEELMKSLSASEQASYFRSTELLTNEDHVTPVMT